MLLFVASFQDCENPIHMYVFVLSDLRCIKGTYYNGIDTSSTTTSNTKRDRATFLEY